jgi:threonine aldolase
MIDLRSDTVTRPTPEMRRAMFEAPVGDDVFGDDPTVNELEEFVAELLGKEAAVYAPSGTMTNQLAVRVQTRPGDEVLLHEHAHIYNYEAGAPAQLSGVQVRPLAGEGGVVSPETLRAAVRPDDVHFARPRLLCLENTHNAAGGRIYPVEDFRAVSEEARKLGLKVHLDGARVFNAAVAAAVPVRDWCALADTVSVCSSKGLGAPVGSLLAGERETIEEARRARKAFGGGMRQAGIIAAGALYAFRNNVERLAEDHARARRLAEGLSEAGYRVPPPETNIVLVPVEDPAAFLHSLAQEGILATPAGAASVRFCTHLDVRNEDIERTVSTAAGIRSAV